MLCGAVCSGDAHALRRRPCAPATSLDGKHAPQVSWADLCGRNRPHAALATRKAAMQHRTRRPWTGGPASVCEWCRRHTFSSSRTSREADSDRRPHQPDCARSAPMPPHAAPVPPLCRLRAAFVSPILAACRPFACRLPATHSQLKYRSHPAHVPLARRRTRAAPLTSRSPAAPLTCSSRFAHVPRLTQLATGRIETVIKAEWSNKTSHGEGRYEHEKDWRSRRLLERRATIADGAANARGDFSLLRRRSQL